MKVFLDTNVLMDFVLHRDGMAENATDILILGNAKFIELYVTDLTIANVAYVGRKSLKREKLYQLLRTLSSCYTVTPIGENAVTEALDAEWNDFEDALQYFAAIHAGVDCIVTRNTKDFSLSDIPVYSPQDFLETI